MTDKRLINISMTAVSSFDRILRNMYYCTYVYFCTFVLIQCVRVYFFPWFEIKFNDIIFLLTTNSVLLPGVSNSSVIN